MRTTIGGVELHYDVHGDGDPVLLVHGFPLSRRMWDGVVAGLGGRWRLIVPDLRGHGASEASDEASMRLYADDLAALRGAWEAIMRRRDAVDLDFRYVRPDGGVRYCHLTARMVVDEAGARFLPDDEIAPVVDAILSSRVDNPGGAR